MVKVAKPIRKFWRDLSPKGKKNFCKLTGVKSRCSLGNKRVRKEIKKVLKQVN